MIVDHIRSASLAFAASLLICGCNVYRDDTTGATRHVVANHLDVDYGSVKADTTLGKLGCDELDIVEIIMSLEESFQISISDSDLAALSDSDKRSDVTILELAKLVRSKRSL